MARQGGVEKKLARGQVSLCCNVLQPKRQRIGRWSLPFLILPLLLVPLLLRLLLLLLLLVLSPSPSSDSSSSSFLLRLLLLLLGLALSLLFFFFFSRGVKVSQDTFGLRSPPQHTPILRIVCSDGIPQLVSPSLSALCVKHRRQGRRAAVLLSRQAPWYMLLCPGVFWWEQLSRSPSLPPSLPTSLPPYLPTYLVLGLHSSLSIPLSLSLSLSLSVSLSLCLSVSLGVFRCLSVSLPLSLSMYISALENPEAMHERLDTTVVDFLAKQDSRTVLERCCWEPNLGMLHRCAHAQDETQQASSWDAYRTLPNHT